MHEPRLKGEAGSVRTEIMVSTFSACARYLTSSAFVGCEPQRSSSCRMWW